MQTRFSSMPGVLLSKKQTWRFKIGDWSLFIESLYLFPQIIRLDFVINLYLIYDFKSIWAEMFGATFSDVPGSLLQCAAVDVLQLPFLSSPLHLHILLSSHPPSCLSYLILILILILIFRLITVKVIDIFFETGVEKSPMAFCILYPANFLLFWNII